jgi:GTP-binding protein LepA
MAACEGALLVVDATQGVEAQTIANALLAMENNLTIIPVINKIDMSNADPERTIDEIERTIGLDCAHAVRVSAKTGEGVAQLLETIVSCVGSPRGNATAATRALVFDGYFDKFRGVVSFLRLVDGEVRLLRCPRICIITTIIISNLTLTPMARDETAIRFTKGTGLSSWRATKSTK